MDLFEFEMQALQADGQEQRDNDGSIDEPYIRVEFDALTIKRLMFARFRLGINN